MGWRGGMGCVAVRGWEDKIWSIKDKLIIKKERKEKKSEASQPCYPHYRSNCGMLLPITIMPEQLDSAPDSCRHISNSGVSDLRVPGKQDKL